MQTNEKQTFDQPEEPVVFSHSDGELRQSETAEQAIADCPFLSRLPEDQAKILVDLAAVGRETMKPEGPVEEPYSRESHSPKLNETPDLTKKKTFKTFYDKEPDQPVLDDERLAHVAARFSKDETVDNKLDSDVNRTIEEPSPEPFMQPSVVLLEEQIVAMEESARKRIAEAAYSATETKQLVEAEIKNPEPSEGLAMATFNKEAHVDVPPLRSDQLDTPPPVQKAVDIEVPPLEKSPIALEVKPSVLIEPTQTNQPEVILEFPEDESIDIHLYQNDPLIDVLQPTGDVLEDELTDSSTGTLAVAEQPPQSLTFQSIKESADQQPPEKTIAEVAILLSEPELESEPAIQVQTEIAEIKEAIHQIVEALPEELVVAAIEASDDEVETIITPHVEKKLIILLEELGYTQPAETLVELKASQDIITFIQSLHYFHKLYNSNDQQEFMPYLAGVTSLSDDSSDEEVDNSFIAQLGKAIVELVKARLHSGGNTDLLSYKVWQPSY